MTQIPNADLPVVNPQTGRITLEWYAALTRIAAATDGMIGEVITANAATVAMVNATAKTITSISLTSGDWDVHGSFNSNPAATTTQSYVRASISTTDNTHDFSFITQHILAIAANSAWYIPTPYRRVSIASTTTIYLVGEAGFATSTLTGAATITARRAR
jgi:hypothetical protein